MRRIGQAKASLAADYTAQLAHSVGKVVFFAKHVDVMDVAEQTFEQRGLRYSSIRGNQTPSARQKSIDAFVNDPDVSVVVCSLSAAGVGVNLQVASDMVLAELSWTDAEQDAGDRTASTASARTSPSPRGASSRRARSTPRSSSSSTARAGLAARALDGSDEEIADSADLQLETLVALLTDALTPA